MAASEMSSSSPTTPPSAVVGRVSSSTPTGRQQGKLHPVIPVVPNIPNLSRANKKIAGSATSEHNKSESVVPSDADNAARTVQVPTQPSTNENNGNTEEASQSLPVPVKAPPKSWADLVRSKVPKGDTTTSSVSGSSVAQSNGHLAIKSESLADVLLAYKVRNRESDTKIAFLKPRGLVNTGNMCYMNSVS
jgi:ubiquitin carboxyl-terminal hydrolase 10